MKKLLSLFVVFCLTLSLCACGGNKKAFEESKVAYDYIDAAYEITEQFGSDVYEAWRMGIYEEDELLEGAVKHLASELSLSEEEIKDGVAYVMTVKVGGKDWAEIPEEDKQIIRDGADVVFILMKEDLFSFCVMVVSEAYAMNGKVAEAQEALNNAKTKMKELSEKYSDYEHYPNLKGYYTTTSSFFDFCQNPTGSFEQVKDTINKYKNEARDYISDLDYIFEE